MNKVEAIMQIIKKLMDKLNKETWIGWTDMRMIEKFLIEHLQDLDSLKEEKKECSHNMTYETNSYIRKCCQCWKIIE